LNVGRKCCHSDYHGTEDASTFHRLPARVG
jgi:hypothetical protein